MKKKILIVMQCWQGDKEMAMKVARLIADIEQQPSQIADVMLSFKNCSVDTDTARYVSRKFGQVHTFQATRGSTGWPSSCNDCFFESFGQLFTRCRSGVWDYDVALFIEPDVVPLTKNWIEVLRDEWYASMKHVVGALYVPPNAQSYQRPHINGNLMIGWKFAKDVKGFHSCPTAVGWDAFWSKELLRHGMPSHYIYSDYARKSITCEELFAKKNLPPSHPYIATGIQPVLYHGVKSMDAYNCVRKHFGVTNVYLEPAAAIE